MRAEGQAHIERIEAALALVRKFLDWERALRRAELPITYTEIYRTIANFACRLSADTVTGSGSLP